jgi:alginate O-acetyltransferase complex protein AlgI
MLFSSYSFLLLFLPLALLLYYSAWTSAHPGAAVVVLIIASLVFYGTWKPIYLTLLLASIAANSAISGKLAIHVPRRRAWLIAGIGFNLVLLGYFKYTHFVLGIFTPGQTVAAITLPLGISFYTFQQIMFLTDIYKAGQRSHGLAYYAASMTFFPHLIAGPIVPYRELMPQFARAPGRALPWEQIAPGIMLFAVGLFKKVMLADPLSDPVARVFDGAARGEALSLADAWGGTLAYTFQLYFDFSGYSDMALGLGHMFGIRLPPNFLSPYKSLSIAEFWRRWHITLSNFLRGHLYIPLGGNRGTKARTACNLMLTMGLGGLWHGAGWTFVIWGLMHGTYLVVNRLWQAVGITLPRSVAWSITFSAVVLGWVTFRAASLDAALSIYRDMFSGALDPMRLITTQNAVHIGLLAAIAFFTPNSIEWIRGTSERSARFRPDLAYAICAVVLLVVATLNLLRVSEFLYFNF